MLKERLRHLCAKKNITYKELIGGLVSYTHFINILSNRYALPNDLALQLAKRLDVNVDYLTKVSDINDEIIIQANKYVDETIECILKESGLEYVVTLPERVNELFLEIIIVLCKILIYDHYYCTSEKNKLKSTYFEYYRTYIESLDKDNLLLQGWQLCQIIEQHHTSLPIESDIITIAYDNPFSKNQKIQFLLRYIEIVNHIKKMQFVEAKNKLENAINYSYVNFDYIALSAYYILTAYIYSLNFQHYKIYEYIEKSDDSLKLTGEFSKSIIPKTIITKIMTYIRINDFPNAKKNLEKLESISSNNIELLEKIAEHRCEIFLKEKNYLDIKLYLDNNDNIYFSNTCRKNLDFYYCQYLYHHSYEYDIFIKKAQECCEFYDYNNMYDKLTILYEQLALIHKERRQYKLSNIFYEKAVFTLKKLSFV